MLDWIHLPIVLIAVTIVMALYALITRSAGIYPSARQFWRSLLLSTGISYALSGSLFLFLGITPVVAVAVSAIVPFLIGNLEFDEKGETAPPEAQSQEEVDKEAAGSEEEEAMEEEAAGIQDERAYEVLYQDRRESEQYN